MPLTSEDVQLIGAGMAALLIGLGTWKGAQKSDGKPPDHRPLAPNELKAEIEKISESQKRIERGLKEFVEASDDDRRELMKEVYRMGARLEALTGGDRSWIDRTLPPR